MTDTNPLRPPCACECKCATVPDWAKDARRWCGCCFGSCKACVHEAPAADDLLGGWERA